ncbi:MAG: SusD/RagB family nutrient-binding outer membrane lipoprotein [Sphingobacteriales bacterium]|nr:SusD/RagB family nutrient-binding outer membrane lipoprotein [Sphingobacteriales bacterium]MBI3720881.1 SusD/RagB family nutrient-binding outer membrane lipoprotein [Sphingobacteriales bacterium]
MKKILLYTTIGLLLINISSCKKYSDFQSNPNQPSDATPALLLTNICYNIFYQDNTQPDFATRHLTYYERGNSAVDYSWRAGSFANYDVLRQIMQMDTLAQSSGQQQYQGLTKLFRALLFSQITEQFGDIPYSKALDAKSGNYKPAYDTQKEVYKGLLKELDEANNLLSDSKGKISGDIVYDGVASKWKKLANALRLRLLMHLSKKEADADLNIKAQFQQVVSNSSTYPLFESNADNAQLVFNSTATNNYYPDYGYLSLSTAVSIEKGFAKILKDRSDPRLFAFAEPVSGMPANVFNSYEGVDAGLTIGDQTNASNNASRIKARYHADKINEPWILMGYAEQEFLIAEAISRNWITGAGTAKKHYENGITASMNFYGITDVAGYLSGTNVVFNTGTALTQIAIQKHIALFMNGGWEAFWEQRRTGIPTLSVGPGTYNNGLVPKRWMYPESETLYNFDNLEIALKNQYGGKDNVNGIMWLLQ